MTDQERIEKAKADYARLQEIHKETIEKAKAHYARLQEIHRKLGELDQETFAELQKVAPMGGEWEGWAEPHTLELVLVDIHAARIRLASITYVLEQIFPELLETSPGA